LTEQPRNPAEKTNQKTQNYNLDLSIQRGHATGRIRLKYGKLKLNTLVLSSSSGTPAGAATAQLEGTFEPVRIERSGNSSEITVQFINPIVVKADQTLTVRVDC
jgi:hypothetical protein